MSLEEIRKSIDRDAKTHADSIEQQGAEEAAAIINTARLFADDILKAARAEAKRELELVKREKVSEAQIEASSMMASAKDDVLERHIGQLKRSISSQLAGRNLDRVLSKAVREFSKFSSKGELVVRTGKRNATLVKKLGYDTVQGKEGDLSVESRDGKVSVDASPIGLAEMYATEARTLLAERLWRERVKR